MSTPKKKNHLVRNIIIVAVLFLIIGIAVNGGKGSKSSSNSSSAASSETSSTTSSKETAKATEDTTEKVSEARSKYQQIVLGDMMDGGTGGTSLEDVKTILGEPKSTSESSIGDTKSLLATWSESDITGSAVFTVTFTNNAATGKGYSGFSLLNTGTKVSLDEFNAIVTDGSFTYDAALEQFGQPDGESETLIGGQSGDMVSWSNANGSLGANFNVTFTNGVATGKSQYGMK